MSLKFFCTSCGNGLWFKMLDVPMEFLADEIIQK
jgi:hypothetical protein